MKEQRIRRSIGGEDSETRLRGDTWVRRSEAKLIVDLRDAAGSCFGQELSVYLAQINPPFPVDMICRGDQVPVVAGTEEEVERTEELPVRTCLDLLTREASRPQTVPEHENG